MQPALMLSSGTAVCREWLLLRSGERALHTLVARAREPAFQVTLTAPAMIAGLIWFLRFVNVLAAAGTLLCVSRLWLIINVPTVTMLLNAVNSVVR